MILTAIKHFLYDLSLNVFFDAINNNFITTDMNLIGKMVRLTNIESGIEYDVIVSAFNEPDYTLPNVRGLVKGMKSNSLDDYSHGDLGNIFIFELDHFSMMVL